MLVCIVLFVGMLIAALTNSMGPMIAGLIIAIILNTAELKWIHSHMHEGDSNGQ